MSRAERMRAALGLALFVGICFLGSWFVAASLRVFGLSDAPATHATRLFITSLLYALTMGWQPIVATWFVRRFIDPDEQFDLGLRPAARIFSVIACLGTLLFTLAAALLAALCAQLGFAAPGLASGALETQLAAPDHSWLGLGLVVAACLATVVLICVQALAEEIGWRGYFLPRAMERFGLWRGLVLHGLVWGLWYAPVLFFASYGQLQITGSLSRAVMFVVTCVLLGVLFGWLRLASESLAPVVLANTTLTLAAGLPYVIHGVDAGTRSAALGPPGWIVLALLIAGLLLSKWRHAVRMPLRFTTLPVPDSQSDHVWVALDGGARKRHGRMLH